MSTAARRREAEARPLGALLVRNALALQPNALTPARLEKAKLCLLDLLSCIYGAEPMPWSAPLLAYALRGCGRGDAPIPGALVRCPPAEAAFLSSALAAGASRSDMHAPSTGHPGLVIFPTILALAAGERVGGHRVEGRTFLLAALAGYEAMGRAGRALVTSENSRRFRPSGLSGPVGAAIAGARLLDLDERQALSALGIAGNAAGGLMEWTFSGAPDLRYQPAQAARAGTAAVLLAREGVEGSHSILEGPAGLLATFGGTPEQAELLAGDWEGPFEIDVVEFKAVPICVYAQAAAFAAKRLVESHSFDASEVDSLRITTFGKALDYPGCAASGPLANPQEARMSIPFAVASVLALKELGDANFAAVGDPRIERLAARAELRRDAAMDAAFPRCQQARIEVTLADGRVHSSFLERLPDFGAVEVRERFQSCAATMLGGERARDLEATIERLESEPDLGRLLDLLQPESPRA